MVVPEHLGINIKIKKGHLYIYIYKKFFIDFGNN